MSAEKSIASRMTPSAGVTRRRDLITGSAAILGAAIGAGIVELATGHGPGQCGSRSRI